MNLSKSQDFFNPSLAPEDFHIVGCGSVGSYLADLLVRAGIGSPSESHIILWDMDIVEAKNVANQRFTSRDIGRPKVEALRDILIDINPDLEDKIDIMPNGWQGETLSGYVFLAVDDITIRQKIVDTNMNNVFVKAMFDCRTSLTNAQHYAVNWANYKDKENFRKTMDFTHEEAEAETPKSACGGTLGVASTVLIVASLCVNNFIQFVKKEGICPALSFDGFQFYIDAAPKRQ